MNQTHRLTEILRPGDLKKLQAIFYSLPLHNIEVEFRERDGKGGLWAWVPFRLFSPMLEIKIDPADVQLEDGTLNLRRPEIAEILAHELTHLGQGRRGFWFRLKMWYWCQKYSYRDRPHEIEAYKKAEEIRRGWES